MTFYRGMRGVADSLLGPKSPFAQGTMALRRVIPGSGPPYNPGPSTTVDYPISGTVRGVTEEHIDGTLVRVGDKVVTIAVPDVEPNTADKVVIDGVVHQIGKIDRKPAAGEPVAFLLFVRV